MKMHGHYWSYCDHCERHVVICGKCGNNCCNGGHGMVDGVECDACPSAYAKQDVELPAAASMEKEKSE